MATARLLERSDLSFPNAEHRIFDRVQTLVMANLTGANQLIHGLNEDYLHDFRSGFVGATVDAEFREAAVRHAEPIRLMMLVAQHSLSTHEFLIAKNAR